MKTSLLQQINWDTVSKADINLLFPSKTEANKIEKEADAEISPLVCAINAENVEAIEALLKKGADPNKKLHLWGQNFPPIGLIGSVSDLDILKLLIANGAKITPENVFSTMKQGLHDTNPTEREQTEGKLKLLLNFFDLPNNYKTAQDMFHLVKKLTPYRNNKTCIKQTKQWQGRLMDLIADNCAQEKDKMKRKPLSPEIIQKKRIEQFIKHLF